MLTHCDGLVIKLIGKTNVNWKRMQMGLYANSSYELKVEVFINQLMKTKS